MTRPAARAGRRDGVSQPVSGQNTPEQTLMLFPRMRQMSPACLLPQLTVRHTTVPMQASLLGQLAENGLQASSCRHFPEQVVPALLGAPTLEVQEKVGQRPEVRQQLMKQLALASQGTLRWPTEGHVTWDQVTVTSTSRTNAASARPATRFIGILRVLGDPAKGDFGKHMPLAAVVYDPGPRGSRFWHEPHVCARWSAYAPTARCGRTADLHQLLHRATGAYHRGRARVCLPGDGHTRSRWRPVPSTEPSPRRRVCGAHPCPPLAVRDDPQRSGITCSGVHR